MLSDKELERALDKIERRIDTVNTLYLQKVGEQVNEIGKLSPASVNKLIQMRKAGTSIDKINQEMQRVTGKNIADVNALYEQALSELYADYELTAIARGIPLPALKDNAQMQTVLTSLSRLTARTMRNWSNTTNISARYKEVVSDAVQAAVSGVGDYNSVMRSALRKAAEDGPRVTYESGVTRRLDTAIRMNIVDGVKHIQQEAQHIIGEQIGADGVELTAHPNSAPDHEPCQGRQFTRAEFEKMQSGVGFSDIDGRSYIGFQRPIGEWNCNHFAFDIVLGVSKRVHTDAELEQWRKANNEGCIIDGEHYTTYEAKQLMRQLETKIRRQKDIATVARSSGDDVLRRQAQSKITQYTAAYKRVSDASGLKTRFERTFVSGFKDVKLPSLTNAAGRDIIEVGKASVTAEPNTITQIVTKTGGISRNYYDATGKWSKQITNNNHGNAKQHPFGLKGEHAHDIVWDGDKVVDRRVRELSEEERKENADIL